MIEKRSNTVVSVVISIIEEISNRLFSYKSWLLVFFFLSFKNSGQTETGGSDRHLSLKILLLLGPVLGR
jgi:hypothetical protein